MFNFEKSIQTWKRQLRSNPAFDIAEIEPDEIKINGEYAYETIKGKPVVPIKRKFPGKGNI